MSSIYEMKRLHEEACAIALQAFDQRDEANRVAKRLYDNLVEVLAQIESLSGYELTKDTEKFKAQSVWDGVIESAGAAVCDASPIIYPKKG